jgi:hypothetical protein
VSVQQEGRRPTAGNGHREEHSSSVLVFLYLLLGLLSASLAVDSFGWVNLHHWEERETNKRDAIHPVNLGSHHIPRVLGDGGPE